MSVRALPLASAALAAGLCVAACLPGDTRPEPARLLVSVGPSPSVAGGFDTADGWRVSFDRLLVAVGDVDLDNDDACNVYAEANYDRLFDFVVAGREKVGTTYGLGSCELEFRFRAPSYDAIVGAGASRGDVTAMRIEQTDRFEEEARASVVALGRATRGEEQKTFQWWFRRSFELTDCPDAGGRLVTTLDLETGQDLEIPLEVRGEELFRESADDDAGLHFDPFAAADADANGEVTFDEMSLAPRPASAGPWRPQPQDVDEGDDRDEEDVDEPSPEELTLEHYVYDELLPRILRVEGGGRCATDQRGRGR